MNEIKQLANYIVTDDNAKAVNLLNSIIKDKIEQYQASVIHDNFDSDEEILPNVR